MDLEPFVNTPSVGKVTTITQVKEVFPASPLPVYMEDLNL